MDLIETIHNRIEDIWKKNEICQNLSSQIPNFNVVFNGNADNGDVSSNIIMYVRRIYKYDVGSIFIDALSEFNDIKKIQIKGAGFLNIFFNDEKKFSIIKDILHSGAEFVFNEKKSKNKKISVEYVSANPTGPIHIGHARNAVLGEFVARIYEKMGYLVTRDYYLNDAGKQVDIFAKTVYLRYEEALGLKITIPEGGYAGEYVKDIGMFLKKKYGNKYLKQNEKQWLEIFKAEAIGYIIDTVQHDLSMLNIKFDVITSEVNLIKNKEVQKSVNILTKRGYTYSASLPVPKGISQDSWDNTPTLNFKSTEFKDIADRALTNKKGGWTYFAGDVGYHYSKLNRKFDTIIDILGVDQLAQVIKLNGVMKILAPQASFIVKGYNLVKIVKDGKPLKISKRHNTFVTLQEVLELISSDALRFFLLDKKQTIMVKLDVDKINQNNSNNTYFYIQYAHARINSIMRVAENLFPEIQQSIGTVEVKYKPHFTEIVNLLNQWNYVVKTSFSSLEPYIITKYLWQLSSSVHSLWSKGKRDHTLRVIDEDNKTNTLINITLLKSVQYVLATGFYLLGITPKSRL